VEENHIKMIFQPWLINSLSELPQGAIDALKKVVLIGFRCLNYYKNNNNNARNNFFKLHTDLYTVDLIFQSNTGNGIAASLDLSRYEFAPDSNSDN